MLGLVEVVFNKLVEVLKEVEEVFELDEIVDELSLLQSVAIEVTVTVTVSVTVSVQDVARHGVQNAIMAAATKLDLIFIFVR